MTKRPNFLFIMTDQQRSDWMSCAGHPVLKTPNIDAIAANGVRFENFHATSPVCMPNRASFMTGRYPTTHGLRSNGCFLPLRANTFVDVLAASGYHTAAIGKSHLQPMTGLPPFDEGHPETGPVAEAWRNDIGDYEQEEPDQYRGETQFELQLPYYGYQHVDMVTDHGDRCGGHYGQWFRQNAPNWRELHDAANELPHNYSCPQAYRTPVPEALYPTAYIKDRAVDYLQGRATNDQPFFAFVSFPDPHH
ncbi:MAG: sulfatase-like hydrolase/transferase, partial [Rhodospirillaceae bacterium]|nr:sulfatase-like hydrolase/transferase [Rhodospirillaceae bacterium]